MAKASPDLAANKKKEVRNKFITMVSKAIFFNIFCGFQAESHFIKVERPDGKYQKEQKN